VELDYAAGRNVYQMVVMVWRRLLVAPASAPERMPFENTLLLEKIDRPVDGRKRDVGIDQMSAPVQFLDVRVITRLGEHAGNDPALARHAKSMLRAQHL
jgi:hypothetical protein